MNEGDVSQMISQDLGDLAAEIPLTELDNVVFGDSGLKDIGKQPWTRGQVNST